MTKRIGILLGGFVIVATAFCAVLWSVLWLDNPSKGAEARVFIDTISEEPRALLAEVADLQTILELYNPNSTLIDNTRFALFDIEMTATTPFRYIVWAGYTRYDEAGEITAVRDSHYQLLTTRQPEPGSDPHELYRELYSNVLQLPDVETFTISLGVNQSKRDNKAKFMQDIGLRDVKVFGKDVDRQFVPTQSGHALTRTPITLNGKQVGERHAVEFPALARPRADIVNRGFMHEIADVKSITLVSRDHSLKPLAQGERYFLGTMAPQAFGLTLNSGETRVVSFTGADGVQMEFGAEGKLRLTVYSYNLRERTTRGSDSSPDENGTREHVNHGVTSSLPSSNVVMQIVTSDTIAFPTLQPSGYLASFAITEHADYNGIEQDNLVMYGNLEGRYEAGSGFIGHGVPVTKTMFPTGNDAELSIANSETGETFMIRQSNVEDHDDYRQQLLEYAQYGTVDIGLHCGGLMRKQGKTTEGITEVVTDMTRMFGSNIWVDHGGRECLWESGWDPDSVAYVLPALKSNDFRFLNVRDDKFGSKLTLVEDGQPGNILFRAPGFDDDVSDDWVPYHFTTSDFVPSAQTFSAEFLDSMIAERSFQNIHAYLPISTLTVRDGMLVKHDWFEPGLAELADRRDRGDIFLATVEDLLDHVLFVRALEVHAVGDTLHVAGADAQTLRERQPTIALIPFGEAVLVSQPALIPDMPFASREDAGVTYLYPEQ